MTFVLFYIAIVEESGIWYTSSMKTQFNSYVDSEIVDALRERARDVGLPVGEVLGVCCKFALGRIPADAMRKLAAERVSRRGPLGGGLRLHETKVIAALERLHAAELKKMGPQRWWTTEDVAHSAGLYVREAFSALRSLLDRGGYVAEWNVDPDKFDRWGRPMITNWQLRPAVAAPAPVAPKPVRLPPKCGDEFDDIPVD